MKKRYIKATMIPRKTVRTAEQHDKIARIYAMAEKLHVKIGAK